MEDSKQRIRDLETLLYSRHCPKHSEEELAEDEEPELPTFKPTNKVTKQYSQDEGRQRFYDINELPDLKITPASEPGSSGEESNNNNFIRTSKITNIFEKPSKNNRRRIPQPTSSEVFVEDTEDGFKVENVWNYNYTNETSIDQEILFESKQISMTTSFRDEFHLGDSLDLNVHTIPEESEEELGNSCCSSNENFLADSRSNSYSSNENLLADSRVNSYSSKENLLADARPLSFKTSALRSGRVATFTTKGEFPNGLGARSSNESDPVLYQRKLASTKDNDLSCKDYDVPDENRRHTSHPGSFSSSREQKEDPESSSTHEIKRLLDGQASKSFKCVSGMDFLRMASMRSLQSDNGNSRRSSWACDSECDSEEEDDASS